MTREYWRKNLTITALVLVCWLALTLVVAFHVVAQGPLLLYAVLIVFYAWYLRKQDRIYAGREPDKEPPWH